MFINEKYISFTGDKNRNVYYKNIFIMTLTGMQIEDIKGYYGDYVIPMIKQKIRENKTVQRSYKLNKIYNE